MRAVIAWFFRRLAAWDPCDRWPSKPVKILPVPLPVSLRTGRGLQGHKIYQYRSAATSCSQAPSPFRKASRAWSVQNAQERTALFQLFETDHATVLQLWDSLQKPHLLGLENLPIPDEWERIFYGP